MRDDMSSGTRLMANTPRSLISIQLTWEYTAGLATMDNQSYTVSEFWEAGRETRDIHSLDSDIEV